ncbi:MAG: hypothetical protein ABJQ41_13880 [Marinomonas sp.]
MTAMTTGPAISTSEASDANGPSDDFVQNWRDVRGNDDIQFEPVKIPPPEPREPGMFDEFFKSIGEFLAGLFGWFPATWPALYWILIIVAVAAALFILYRLVEPYLGPRADKGWVEEEPEWQPDAAQSIALLEDADRLAAQGKYDEATHLLLQRSVVHLSEAKPDWVEPSSTARELVAIEALPDKARATFGVIAERVERSLFALRALSQDDWEAARAAYADFAATSLKGPIG